MLPWKRSASRRAEQVIERPTIVAETEVGRQFDEYKKVIFPVGPAILATYKQAMLDRLPRNEARNDEDWQRAQQIEDNQWLYDQYQLDGHIRLLAGLVTVEQVRADFARADTLVFPAITEPIRSDEIS